VLLGKVALKLNLIRRIKMGILSGNPTDEPMHYGEVFSTWSFLLTVKGAIASYQTHLNHAGDEDLQKLLKEAIEGGQQEVKQIETLLKANGVGLPPTPPERPTACLDDIPVGARFADPEISAMLSASIAAGLVACSTIIGQSIREDIAMMFGQFHIQKAALGAKALRLNKEKGWLIPPPLHHYKAEDC
jgi:uncharacterized protein DUF3231